MKISFVIPAFNEEKYIKECIDSVIKAATKHGCDHEIIVVNNASTDNTSQIVSEFKNVTLIQEPQKGLSRARAAGYRASTGDLIANIDADTRLPGTWIPTVQKAFKNKPDLIALSGPHKFYDAPKITKFWVKLFYGLVYLVYLINRYILKTGSLLQGGNFVIKKTALKQIGGYDSNYTFYGEDADMARRLFKIGPVDFTFKLPIYASARRLKGEGVLRSALSYAAGYFSAVHLKKPLTVIKEEDFR